MRVYGVQNIVTGKVKGVYVVRLRFYANKDLEMTAALKGVFQHVFTQGEFEMARIVDISEAEEVQGLDVKDDWVGFNEGESSWEPLAIIWDGAPQFVKSELRKLRLDLGVCSRFCKLLHYQAHLIYFLVVTELWECCRVGKNDDWEDTRLL